MDSEIFELIIKNIEIRNGCWEYTKKLSPQGYGRIFKNGKQISTHRFMWEYANKRKIPDGMYICHKCDNPCCVNPNHLFCGTNSENQKDAVKKGRRIPYIGESHANSKLTKRQVIEIINYWNNKSPQKGRLQATKRTLANKYGVCVTSIHRIVNGTGWKHINRGG